MWEDPPRLRPPRRAMSTTKSTEWSKSAMNRILSFFRGLFGSGGSRAHGHGADPGYYHGGEDRRYDETEEDYVEEDGSYDDVGEDAPEEESPADAGAEDPDAIAEESPADAGAEDSDETAEESPADAGAEDSDETAED